ncbi:hypothetical protein [Nonomuraea sp. KM88]|uniref:hypothetical protein n=1 Tax=Nonomuraea sp. KM88 TaxID=3457427 RepID=UPI003FCDF13C
MPSLFAALGMDDQTEEIRNILVRKHTTARDAMISALEGVDVEARLRAAGLGDDEVTALRYRLVQPA